LFNKHVLEHLLQVRSCALELEIKLITKASLSGSSGFDVAVQLLNLDLEILICFLERVRSQGSLLFCMILSCFLFWPIILRKVLAAVPEIHFMACY
jgi:hypothetical protein